MKLIEIHNRFLKPNLDVLFVALNPPRESNENGHYFSGTQSKFYEWIYDAGLTTSFLDKKDADTFIFGDNEYNYNYKKFGVIDVVKKTVNSDSKKVSISDEEYLLLVDDLLKSKPKNIVFIHGKIKSKIERKEKISLNYGYNGKSLQNLGIESNIFICHFPISFNMYHNPIQYYQEIKKHL